MFRLTPSKVANGTFETLPSPPIANGHLGASQLLLQYNCTTATINDNGPNQGFQYVPALTDNSSHYWYEISPDLKTTTSQCYSSQCGNYNSQTNTGFVSAAALLSNTQEHEYGTTLGHYQQYLGAYNDPTNNLADIGEPQIAAPGTTVAAFVSQTQSVLDAAVTGLLQSCLVRQPVTPTFVTTRDAHFADLSISFRIRHASDDEDKNETALALAYDPSAPTVRGSR